MAQILQIAGALAILAAFGLAQLRLLDQHAYSYLVLNLGGAAVLAVAAYFESQWGFLLLESVWAVVSLAGLVARVRADRRVSAR